MEIDSVQTQEHAPAAATQQPAERQHSGGAPASRGAKAEGQAEAAADPMPISPLPDDDAQQEQDAPAKWGASQETPSAHADSQYVQPQWGPQAGVGGEEPGGARAPAREDGVGMLVGMGFAGEDAHQALAKFHGE